MGGYKAQGMNEDSARQVEKDAYAVQKAGAFGIVLEGVAEAVAAKITRELSAVTIGIGASPSCDGQVLVTEDMLGINGDKVPKFVKRFASLNTDIEHAVQSYADEVRATTFPEMKHCFGVKK
jgi:3-methyl-2-oxobutanoate hydroxymethyltransferase